jgi:hypothetical protein
MSRPHVGDCPHHPDERVRHDDPFTGRYVHSCGLCGLSGEVRGSAREAETSFLAAVKRERRNRSLKFGEETHLDSIESLMREPPGPRLTRARRI